LVLIGIGRLLDADYRSADNRPLPYIGASLPDLPKKITNTEMKSSDMIHYILARGKKYSHWH